MARALAYFPKDRFQSAGDMQIELTKYLYSTYHDFSPQKLAAFVRDIFSSQIAQQREKSQSVSLRGSKTGSVSIAQEALQEEIVHRNEASPKSVSFRTSSPKARIEPPFEPTDRTERSSALRRIGIAASIVMILGSVGFVYWQLLHPRLFPPVKLTQPILGEAIVDSTPQGATIIIDGTDTGKLTPAHLTDLQVGKSYALKLSKTGYSNVEQSLVAASAQTPTTVTLSLAEARGTLQLSSVPNGAEIQMDGAPTGKTTPDSLINITLNTNHRMVLHKEGYTDYEQVFNLGSDKPQAAEITLQAIPQTPTPPPTPVEVTPPAPPPTEPAKVETPPQQPQPQPPPEQKAKEPAKQTSVAFASTPPGAKVILDGRVSGTTPTTISKLDVGSTHTVSIEKQGFTPYRHKFTLSSEKTITVAATLKEETKTTEPITKVTPTPPEKPIAPPVQPQPPVTPVKPEPQKVEKQAPAAAGGVGSIRVSSDPSGAEVFINGEMRGTAPLTISNVPSGSVKIILNKEGQSRYSTQIQLSPGETKNLGTVKLGEIFGEVSVNSSPPRAEVTLDGTPYGSTPLNIRKVKRDKAHHLRVTLDGYQPWETSFSFGDDKVKKFNVSLEAR